MITATMPREIASRRASLAASLGTLLALLSFSGVYGECQQSGEPVASQKSSGTDRSVLVELFTSEGCSSCPPADALLLKMDAAGQTGGAQLIVLSEHVDYWDHDGWKDANSSAALTERQEDYVHALRLNTPYTPQIIVDGSAEMRANVPEQANKILQQAAAGPKIPVHINDVTFDGDNLRLRIDADGSSDEHNADVFVAVALDRVESQVLHGENGGRHLTHVAVVQQITKIGKLSKGKIFNQSVQLKLKPGTNPNNVRIVAFVQEPGPRKLLGAALHRPNS